MIYLIQAGDLPFLKIGYSENIQGRIANMQTHCPVEIRCLVERNGSMLLEREIHRRLREYRARLEWFHHHPFVIKCFFDTYDPDHTPLSHKDLFRKRSLEKSLRTIQDRSPYRANNSGGAGPDPYRLMAVRSVHDRVSA